MRIDVSMTTEGAEGLHLDGKLVSMETGERGELTVYAHDPDGRMTGALVVAPGEWEYARWDVPPDQKDVEAYRAWQTKQHGQSGRGGFL